MYVKLEVVLKWLIIRTTPRQISETQQFQKAESVINKLNSKRRTCCSFQPAFCITEIFHYFNSAIFYRDENLMLDGLKNGQFSVHRTYSYLCLTVKHHYFFLYIDKKSCTKNVHGGVLSIRTQRSLARILFLYRSRSKSIPKVKQFILVTRTSNWIVPTAL